MTSLHPRHSIFHSSRVRQGAKLSLDILLALLAWTYVARMEGGSPPLWPGGAAWVLLVGFSVLGWSLPRRHYRMFGFRDALRLALSAASLVIGGVLLFESKLTRGFDLGAWISAAVYTGVLWTSLRVLFRLGSEIRDQRRFTDLGISQGDPTLIIGAGRAGVLVAQELQRHQELGCRVAGFLDDALEKQGLMIHEAPVLGTTHQLEAISREKGIKKVILAIPSESGAKMRALSSEAARLKLNIKTVPGLYSFLGARAWRPELRDLSIEDLLRRDPVRLDHSNLALAIEGETVLVTGAGGSIGQEIARQTALFRPKRLILLGRGENSLWETERLLSQEFPDQPIAIELCDIRSPHRLAQVFARWRPSIVFHAAAHKHVPYLEQHPVEGVENNVFGTKNVLDLALIHKVQAFVNISTDKAVNPTSVLGATKRLAETLVLDASQRAPKGARYSSVRFGNVLGSRGSVVRVFQDQIRAGGPVTVTHPDMTRYFMTIPEASQLVLQAGLLGQNGKIYVLDMGQPVRITHLAEDMIRLSGLIPGQDIELNFTGIRPGEKLFEELFYPHESGEGQVHPKVFEAQSERLAAMPLPEVLAGLQDCLPLPEGHRQRQILQWMLRAVPNYTPSPAGLGQYLEDHSEILEVS